jgi:hypothetical protein
MNKENKMIIVENVNDLKALSSRVGNFLIFEDGEPNKAVTIKEIALLDELIHKAQNIKELLTL